MSVLIVLVIFKTWDNRTVGTCPRFLTRKHRMDITLQLCNIYDIGNHYFISNKIAQKQLMIVRERHNVIEENYHQSLTVEKALLYWIRKKQLRDCHSDHRNMHRESCWGIIKIVHWYTLGGPLCRRRCYHRLITWGMCQEALDLERSNGEERTESKCRKDKDHDLRYGTGSSFSPATCTIRDWNALSAFTIFSSIKLLRIMSQDVGQVYRLVSLLHALGEWMSFDVSW